MPNENGIAEETLTNSDFMPSQELIDSFKDAHIEGSENIDIENSNDSGDSEKTKTEKTEKPSEEDVLNDTKFNDEFSKRFENKYKNVDELKEHLSKQKSFETELDERTEGKYKTFDELKAKLEEEKTEFANDKIKFLNELAKNGHEINDAYIAEINRDYESMKDNTQILAAGLRKEHPDWTEKEINLELKTKYRTAEWDIDVEDQTEEQKELAEVMNIKIERDSANTKAKLITDRDALKYIKPKDLAQEAQVAKEALKAKESFEKHVDNEVIGKLEKISFPVSFDEKGKAKEMFDFTVDSEVKGEVANIVKLMGSDLTAFWKQDKYKNDKGGFDLTKISTDIAKLLSFEKSGRLAHETAFGKGRETEVKTIKNVNFEHNPQKTGSSQKQTMDDAMAEVLMKNL